jgi:hypothetical protein
MNPMLLRFIQQAKRSNKRTTESGKVADSETRLYRICGQLQAILLNENEYETLCFKKRGE